MSRWIPLTTLLALTLIAIAPARADDGNKLVDSRESLYNNIYVYREGPYLAMTFGYNKNLYTESLYNPLDDRELPVPYTRFMTVGLAYPRKVDSILEIGFGGGRTSWYLHKFLPDASVTSAELDPAVMELAQKYFGIKAEQNFNVVQQDGRIFLSSSPRLYDLILIDAYRGPFVPFQLLTKQFYEIVKQHLAAGGVVAQNIEPTTMLFDSAVNTIHSVFANLDFYPAEGNIVVIAYDGKPRTEQELAAIAAERQSALHLRYDLTQLVTSRQSYASAAANVDPKAAILTDDFAPVEALKAIKKHNQKWTSNK
ncbi:MAG TPA: fused MFS/spermidine synthase [Verrucomicrobiae bacterium]|nr:fused MFS/spermidine synthase [Verrucomicrobiae bacterium]